MLEHRGCQGDGAASEPHLQLRRIPGIPPSPLALTARCLETANLNTIVSGSSGAPILPTRPFNHFSPGPCPIQSGKRSGQPDARWQGLKVGFSTQLIEKTRTIQPCCGWRHHPLPWELQGAWWGEHCLPPPIVRPHRAPSCCVQLSRCFCIKHQRFALLVLGRHGAPAGRGLCLIPLLATGTELELGKELAEGGGAMLRGALPCFLACGAGPPPLPWLR